MRERRDQATTSGRGRARELASAIVARRWLALGLLAVAAFTLGAFGFRAYFDGVGVEKSTSDLLYLSLQLFTLESGSVPDSGPPWQLEVARLIAPATSATALMAALATAFRRQIDDWQLHRQRDHVVVCGLGARGNRLARELLETGVDVVGVDLDEGSDGVGSLRRRRAAIVIGDARDPATLRRLRLDRATHLVCLTGNDDTNAEIALQAGALVERRRGPALSCLSQIRDPGLCLLMRSDELATAHRRGFRLDFFNVEERAARVMVREHSPFGRSDHGDGAALRVLVIGASRLGESLVVEIGRRWRSRSGAMPSDPRITVTLVDPHAAAVATRLGHRFPLLEHAVRLDPVESDLDPLDTDGIGSDSPTTIAYVCMNGDAGAVQAALRVHHALAQPTTPIVVALEQTTGIARVIDRTGHAGQVRPFDVLDRTMRPDLLLGGTYEMLARSIHEEYVDEQLRQGADASTNPSMAPWEELPDSLKESNRDQAAHVGTKLAAIGCDIAPLTDWDAERKTFFTDDQVEFLAELEHERWVEQRRRDGWTSGPKDVAAKRTPYLGAWGTLGEEAKELDRQAVRGIPAFLARAGYQIVAPAD